MSAGRDIYITKAVCLDLACVPSWHGGWITKAAHLQLGGARMARGVVLPGTTIET